MKLNSLVVIHFFMHRYLAVTACVLPPLYVPLYVQPVASLLRLAGMRSYLFFLLFAVTAGFCFGQGGIRGTIKADDGTMLAYATIYVRQTGTGNASDLQGRYDVALPPGIYDVLFQYLGYETQARQITVTEAYQDINITMKAQVMVLQNVTVRAGKEDPAYTIMRKAIAKAKYHTQQLDSYSARVYIKGKGQLKDFPWFAKKQLEKEGITKDRVFIQESVSDIKYTRPARFEEKVVAIYTSGNVQSGQSPAPFIFGSFYEPEIANIVSPLAPRSFGYYKFEYLGTFKDGDREVSKIKVTPRSRGDNVVEGILNIVEEWWAIHSLDFKTTNLGISAEVKQLYSPIADPAFPNNPAAQAWLPISQQFVVSGKILGFAFEGNYLATMRDYKISLNKLLVQPLQVIDEKVEKEKAVEVKKKAPARKAASVEQRLAAGNEVTDKELRQLMRTYEQETQQAQPDPDVVAESTYTIDSTAYKQDSTFWLDMRPTPLTREEERGYATEDSLAQVEKKKAAGDTLENKNRKNRAGFQPWDLLSGDSYKLTETASLRLYSLLGGFNTVEGVNLIQRTSFYKRWALKDSAGKERENYRLEVSPVLRYAFARERLSGFLRTEFRANDYRITLDGGRYVKQFNSDEPILPIVNTLTTLLLGDNLMKLYEHDFVQARYRHRVSDKYTVRSQWMWNRRYALTNQNAYTLFARNRDQYTPNAPLNDELADTGFEPHEGFVGSVGVDARPWLKYRIRNGNRERIESSAPLFSLDYRKGFATVLGSDVNFDQIEAGVRHRLNVGIRGSLDIAVRAGAFLNNRSMYFMDYKHFLGNRTPFVTTDPIGSFRLLDYYQFSTTREYLITNAHYHFRKLLVSRIPKVRLMGITENVFVNYLGTSASRHYTEVGYALDGILRLFRLEAAAAFRDGRYLTYGVRIGIARSITVQFDE